MLLKQIALVSLSKKISAGDLSQTASALQKQVTRDLGPIWNISATVDYFPDLKSVPLGYWPIIISENINEPGAAGFHTDKHHQPYSLVQLDDTWQLTCSHEMCEMLVDPYGNRMATAGSPETTQGKVNFLVEVCDPCEDASFAYSINGILVSDFYTPNYFDPQQVGSVRYSFTGAITTPGQILKNGYISWQDPVSRQWYQANFFGASLAIQPLKGMQARGESLRAQVDRLTTNPNTQKSFSTMAKQHQSLQANIFRAGESRSSELREEIQQHAPTSANLTVSFNNSVDGSLVATLTRDGGSTDTLTFDVTGGTQTFENVFADDTIDVHSVTGGDVDLTIDRETNPGTPVNLPGEKNTHFRIL